MEEDSSLLAGNVHIPPTDDDLSVFLQSLSLDATPSNKKDFSFPAAKRKPEFFTLMKDVQDLVSTAKTEYEPVAGQDETIAQRHCMSMMKKLIAYLRNNFDSCAGLDAVDTHKAKSSVDGDPIRSPDVSIQEKKDGHPFESLLLVEVKSQKKAGNLLSATNNDWIGQVNTYAQRQLRKAPWLVSKFLFVTDMDIVRVCWFRRSENGPHGYLSKMSKAFQLNDPDTIMKLLYILHESYQTDILDLASIRPSLSQEVLGVGASAVVCVFEKTKVIKCFFTHDKDSTAVRKNEEDALQLLKEYDADHQTNFVGKHVVRLCGTDTSGTRLILEPKGRAAGLYPAGLLSKASFIPIVKVLKALHKSNFVHRDVGPSNIIVHGNELELPLLCLIDFGFLKNASTREVYSGATYFASDRILKYFGGDWKMQEEPLNETGEDDLESLVKTVAYCVCPFVRFRIDRLRARCRNKKHTLSRLPNVILEEWNQIRGAKYPHSDKLLNKWAKHIVEPERGDSYVVLEKLLAK